MKFLKSIIALLLLPALFAAGHFLCRVIWLHAGQWEKIPWTNLGSFAIGFSAMTCVYFTLPRWNWLYVFGHESTHALAVLMSGGRVSEFKVSSGGGHVATDKMSAWIALSPYIVPFYPLMVGLLWFVARWIWPAPLATWEWAFIMFWGLCWAFHLCFTASLLKTDQPDFASQGYFFSIVVILLCNLLIVGVLLWIWLEPGSWRQGGRELWGCFSQSYLFCAGQLRQLYKLAFSSLSCIVISFD
ncbi:MAG: hypothetical protein LBH01_10750 [Verrucomicrobiales bacterium]|nr:hypothetical protein [Verrucomicrobiales bacterium]